MYKNSRGREGVKTVKMLSGCVMSSRLDVMQLLFFFFLRKTQADHKEEKCEERETNSVMWSVCMSVLVFHLGHFLLLTNTDVGGGGFSSSADH